MRICLVTILSFIAGCATLSNNSKFLSVNELSLDKKIYNEYLIDNPNGLHKLSGLNVRDSTLGIILVHGYYPKKWDTKGFEWVTPIFMLSEATIPLWFFRYDWNECPNNSADFLDSQIENLILNNPGLDSLWILGHSFGGIVSSLFSEQWDQNFPLTVHTIATPLATNRFEDSHCSFKGKKTYEINENITYTQWKTVKNQDGAFKHLEFDPQNVLIKGGKVITLPETWKNTRLGHNKSIQWVCEKVIRKIR